MNPVRIHDVHAAKDWVEFKPGASNPREVLLVTVKDDVLKATACLNLAGAEQVALALIEFIRNHPETQAAQAAKQSKAAAEAEDAEAIYNSGEWCESVSPENGWYCTRPPRHGGNHVAACGTVILERWPR